VSVVEDLSLVMVGTVVISCTWYGIAPHLSEARTRQASRAADRRMERELRGALGDHGTTPA
jgi:hypothetical protein